MAAGDDAAALEASLIENSARLDPDPMTRYETFTRLVRKGKTAEEIAETFGITTLMVERNLALGNLIPKIREAYRAEEIEAETIRHLTLASKAQQRAWFALFEDPQQNEPQSWQLKAWLFGAEISTSVALFSLDDFPGEIVSDLFGEVGYFADATVFWTHQNAAIAAERDALAAKGWDVEVLEIGQRFDRWNHTEVAQKDGGRVYIAVARSGEVEVHKGYLSAKEARRKEKAKAAAKDDNASAKDGETPAEAAPARPELTKAAQNYLELHRHAAVRHKLLSDPGVALRLVIAHAIAGSAIWTVEADHTQPASEAIGNSIAGNTAHQAFEKERQAVLKILGAKNRGDVVSRYGGATETARIFAVLLKLKDPQVMRVLAFVMAETLEAGTSVVEALGNHLAVDMAEAWQPDQTFFDLLRDKAAINAMVKEVAGKAVADAHVTSTAKVQKQLIRDCLAGANDRPKVENWLPRYMGFPFKAYDRSGGIGIAEGWGEVKRHFKAS